jgi:AraC-like DNA-binding protein
MGAITDRLSATSLGQFEVAELRLVLPDTSLDLAWVNGRIDAIGPMTHARPSRYAVGTRVTLLSVDPATAAEWLGLPLSELTDRVVDLRDIHAERAKGLEAQFEAGTIGEWVEKCVPATSRASVAMAALMRGATVADVAGKVNLSGRQLTRSFHDTVGLHPKRFQQISRLRRSVVAAKAGMALAEAAIEGGYADQAHFTREVKALTGATPRAILPNVGNVQDLVSRIG